MIDVGVCLAGSALVIAVAAGLLAHEWSHALALRLAGIEYDLEYGPSRRPPPRAADANSKRTALANSRVAWATVSPRVTGDEPAWHLRLAALTPLCLPIPLVAILASGGAAWLPAEVVSAAMIGWIACAIPSPQDFSVALYAHRVLEAEC